MTELSDLQARINEIRNTDRPAAQADYDTKATAYQTAHNEHAEALNVLRDLAEA